MRLEFHAPDPYIFGGLSVLLLALSSLKSLSLFGFFCSEGGNELQQSGAQ